MIKEKFQEIFGVEADEIYSASGRVNLIGEHVDYCDGTLTWKALNLLLPQPGAIESGQVIINI